MWVVEITWCTCTNRAIVVFQKAAVQCFEQHYCAHIYKHTEHQQLQLTDTWILSSLIGTGRKLDHNLLLVTFNNRRYFHRSSLQWLTLSVDILEWRHLRHRPIGVSRRWRDWGIPNTSGRPKIGVVLLCHTTGCSGGPGEIKSISRGWLMTPLERWLKRR